MGQRQFLSFVILADVSSFERHSPDGIRNEVFALDSRLGRLVRYERRVLNE